MSNERCSWSMHFHSPCRPWSILDFDPLRCSVFVPSPLSTARAKTRLSLEFLENILLFATCFRKSFTDNKLQTKISSRDDRRIC